MKRVVHFEIHAENPERAAAFYRDIFGWEIKEWVVEGTKVPEENRYWLVMTGKEEESRPSQNATAGINGGIVKRRGPGPKGGEPVTSYVCTVDVPNLDETLEDVVKHGGALSVPKMAIPGVGWLAYCKDTEGNIFGIMQSDTEAK